MRARGTGSIYRQPGTSCWTIQYYVNGRRVREKTGTDDRKAAQQKLTQRLAQIDKGEPIIPTRRKPLLVSDLYDGLEKDYIRQRNRTLRSIKYRWTIHLKPFFGNLTTGAVDKDLINSYRDSRLAQGAAGASINRETAMLKRMYRLAAEKLPKLPAFPEALPEDKRTGFLEDEEFCIIAANASELWLRAFLQIAYDLGWRRSEILGLRCRQVNLLRRTLMLDTSKNDHGRECPMTPKIYELLKECVAGKGNEDHALTRKGNRPVRDFRTTWKKLCEKIGRPNLLPHDFRRAAARNLRRAGCSENTIMAIGGWETASVFRRYDIHDNRDKEFALVALEQKRIADKARLEAEQQARAEFGHKDSHSRPSEEQSEAEATKGTVN